MTSAEVREKLRGAFNVVSFRKGIFTAKRSYFYGITKPIQPYIDKVIELIPNAEIVDSGNHFHAFCGGAKSGSAKDSFYWVSFKLKD